VSIDEVRSLVAERQRYDDWLTALDGRRAETPSHVFDRVYGDYVARRDAVLAQLREHVGALATHGTELGRRLSTLEAELTALEDERVEAMLRTAVGEYDGNRWETVRQDVEAKIASLGEQRGGLLAGVDEIRILLASATSEPPAANVEAPAQAAVEDIAVEDIVVEDIAVEDIAEEDIAEEDIAYDASSIASPSSPNASAEPAASAPSVPVNADETFDDLAFLRSVNDPTAAPSNDPLKTLRCTECGTMNLPTEWYCERCGGELAAF
jgi:hypothetical protein